MVLLYESIKICMIGISDGKQTDAPAGPGDPGVPPSPRGPCAPSDPRAPVGPASPWQDTIHLPLK